MSDYLTLCHDKQTEGRREREALGAWHLALGKCRYGCRLESSAVYFKDEGGEGGRFACV